MSTVLLRAFESARSGNWSTVQQVCNEFVQRRVPTVRAAEPAAGDESSSESSGPDDDDVNAAADEDDNAPTLEPVPRPQSQSTGPGTTSGPCAPDAVCTSVPIPMQMDDESTAFSDSASAPPSASAAAVQDSNTSSSADGDEAWSVVSHKQPRRPRAKLPR